MTEELKKVKSLLLSGYRQTGAYLLPGDPIQATVTLENTLHQRETICLRGDDAEFFYLKLMNHELLCAQDFENADT